MKRHLLAQACAPFLPEFQRVPTGSAAITDFEVALPPHLSTLGASVRATLSGGAGPALVVLGGISATRFACAGADGGPGWWPGLVEEGGAINPRACAVLSVDFAADASGRIAPTTGEQAEVVVAAMDAAGIGRATLVGASYGGMVALSLAARWPERVERLVVISAPARAHPMATAIRELQRRTVKLGIEQGCGEAALAIARGWAMLSYRTPEEFAERFAGGLGCADPCAVTAPGAYLRARGEAFAGVMTPERFLSLSGSIDLHAVDPGALTAPALLIGADCDQLVPAEQMRELAREIGGPATLHVRASRYGHDMFLKDAGEIGRLVAPFLAGSCR